VDVRQSECGKSILNIDRSSWKELYSVRDSETFLKKIQGHSDMAAIRIY
jgi:hypothetical protein